jgi:7-cyano-7-deazaguanine reductase
MTLDQVKAAKPTRDYEVEFVFPEFTSLCPVTGQPDFATITVTYTPDERCVEMKSLKLYFFAFRNRGIFYEGVTNCIRDDLAKLLDPVWIQIITDWRGRGGIRSTIRADYGAVPAQYLGR